MIKRFQQARISAGKSEIKPTRKTIRKHINAMLNIGMIVKVGRKYYSTSDYISTISPKLKKNTIQLLSSDPQEIQGIAPADDVAIYSISSNPSNSHKKFNDLLFRQVIKFKDNFMWLDDILEDALYKKILTEKIYSPRKNKVDRVILQQGLKKYFGNNQLFAFSVAISPPKFIKFLISGEGNEYVTNHLQKNWGSIVGRVKARWEHEEVLRSKRRGK